MNETLPPFLQERLDRGGDPLADPAVQQWLLDHPEQLAPFAALSARLAALRPGPLQPAAPPPRPMPRRTWWLAAGLAAAAAAIAAWCAWPAGPTVAPRPSFADARILTIDATSGRSAEALTVRRVFAPDASRCRVLTTHRQLRPHTPAVPFCAATVHLLSFTDR